MVRRRLRAIASPLTVTTSLTFHCYILDADQFVKLSKRLVGLVFFPDDERLQDLLDFLQLLNAQGLVQ